MSLFMGIDPGASGGIAVVGALPLAWKMPETEKDIADLLDVFTPEQIGFKPKSKIDFAMIERVHSMPKQGVVSSFKFGRNYGFLRGMLIAHRIPFDEVSPQVWQRAMGCLTRGDKNVSKAKAQQLFPTLKITHATADAILIAEYCRRTRTNGANATELIDLAEKLKGQVTA